MNDSLVQALAGVLAAVSVGLGIALVRARRRLALVSREAEHYARDLEKLERAFACFAPAAVVDQVFERGITITAEKREVTVMFADLQGFTSMSERMDPTDVVHVLNGYFEMMCGAIKQNHGQVNQLIGDGLMAVFGALENNPWQQKDAVAAALEMRRALELYNQKLAADGKGPLSFGIGIHSGVVVAGVMGSTDLMDFTVIGDVVNTAARVEGLTRVHKVDILVTPPVRERLQDRFSIRELPPTPVKGKAEPLTTFAVDGWAPQERKAG